MSQSLCENYSGQQLFQRSLMCGTDCWSVSESGTENMLSSDSSSESPRPPLSQLRFSSKHSTPWDIFRKGRIVSVTSSAKRDRGKSRLSSEAVRDFCSLPARVRRCRTVYSSAHWKLVSYRILWTAPAMLPVFLCVCFFLQML